MKIAICDDEEESIIITKRYTEKFFEENKIKYEIKCFTCAERLLEENDTFDLYLLDIEMEYINGIQLGEIIRSKDNMTPIVYITNYIAYWRRAYSVHAFDYITKPMEKESIYRVLTDFISLKRNKEEQHIIIKINGKQTLIDSKDIVNIIVKEKGNIDIRCTYCVYNVKNVKLNSLLEQLGNSKFYMCHRSCIVNIDYVDHIENEYDIIMKNGEFCPLSQKKKKEFLNFIFSSYNVELRRQK